MLTDTARPRLPLTDYQAQRLDGWIRMLDVDLELAQRVLRETPAHLLPLPPVAMPAVTTPGWDGRAIVLAPEVEAPAGEAEAVELPVNVVMLRGAYARRAAVRPPV